MNIYFDIETLPTSDPWAIDEMRSTITAPANYKKPESIAEWMAENAESALKEKVSKTSFDGALGRICVICAAIDDDPVFSFSASNESQLLAEFYNWITDNVSVDAYERVVQSAATFVGHNIASFDLPFLKHRSIINRVKPPVVLLKAMNAKPWDSCIADTMLMWSADREKRASMDKLCKAFGINGKDGFDGSMVAETWPVDPQKVIDYCCDDVLRTRQLYKRMTFSE